MTVLSRDTILGAEDRPQETVHVPEWGGDVIVRGMTVRERDAFEASLQKPTGKAKANGQRAPVQATEFDWSNFRAKLAVRCIVGEDGERIFEDGDAEQLGRKSALAVSRVFDVAQRLNGMSNQDIEELAGNSAVTAGDASSSGSRSRSAGQSAS